jgi:hypothetical protein
MQDPSEFFPPDYLRTAGEVAHHHHCECITIAGMVMSNDDPGSPLALVTPGLCSGESSSLMRAAEFIDGLTRRFVLLVSLRSVGSS